MSYQIRANQVEGILQRNLVRINKRKGRDVNNAKAKMWFFKDIFEKPNQIHIQDRIEARKLSLVKQGYWTPQGEITELGYNQLIKYLLKQINK